jgi:hypothetical protein
MKMACSEPKHVALLNVLINKIIMLDWKLFPNNLKIFPD